MTLFYPPFYYDKNGSRARRYIITYNYHSITGIIIWLLFRDLWIPYYYVKEHKISIIVHISWPISMSFLVIFMVFSYIPRFYFYFGNVTNYNWICWVDDGDTSRSALLVAEGSKIGNRKRRGWLLWITDGRANPLMERKVLGVVFLEWLQWLQWSPTSPTTAGCSVV